MTTQEGSPRSLPEQSEGTLPLDIYAVADKEVQEIRALIPPKGVPVEERAKLNAIVRERLPLATDLALVGLMLRDHGLSRREFMSRLNSQRLTQMEAPFELLSVMHSYNPFWNKLMGQLHEATVKCAASTSVDRVVNAFERYEESILGRDDQEIFADILNSHPEPAEIVRLFLERKDEIPWYTYWIGNIKKLAQRRASGETLPDPTAAENFRSFLGRIRESWDTTDDRGAKTARIRARKLGSTIIETFVNSSAQDQATLKDFVITSTVIRPDMMRDIYDLLMRSKGANAAIVRDLLSLPPHGPRPTNRRAGIY